jgi:hypothetical protein
MFLGKVKMGGVGGLMWRLVPFFEKKQVKKGIKSPFCALFREKQIKKGIKKPRVFSRAWII